VEARGHLHAALEALQRLGARPWVAEASDLLQASGHSRRPHTDVDATLTPRQHRIAMAVAEGLTNKQVAHRLLLSNKTVEHELTTVYRTLGISSRTQLARHPSLNLADI
jgi:DNA-binding NarL/FixJ family response regulator